MMGHMMDRLLPYLKTIRGIVARHRTKPQLHTTLFVTSVQRSGTNLLMRILDRSWETPVFHDSDPRAYEEFELRSKDVLRGLIARSPTEFVAFKPLLNADQLSDLLSEHRPAKAMWIFRDCFDVVNSLIQKWPGGGCSFVNSLIENGPGSDWRSRGMTEFSYETVLNCSNGHIDDASGYALFWWVRNKLFFDQNLHHDSQVLAVFYESLVKEPALTVSTISQFCGFPCLKSMERLPQAGSVCRQKPPVLDSSVRDLCETMAEKLQSVVQ